MRGRSPNKRQGLMREQRSHGTGLTRLNQISHARETLMALWQEFELLGEKEKTVNNWNRALKAFRDEFGISAKIEIESMSFSNQKLVGLDLSNLVIFDLHFTQCDLQGINFSDSQLSTVSINECHLGKAQFNNVSWEQVEMTRSHGSDIQANNLTTYNGEMVENKFTESNFANLHLTNSVSLDNTKFINCDLRNLKAIDLTNSLNSIYFKNCNLRGMHLKNVIGDNFMAKDCGLRDSVWDMVTYYNDEIDSRPLKNVRVENARFTSCTLPRTFYPDLKGAILDKCVNS